ncbi:MAG: helix-turn-helix domain-containing protein [Pirellulales bacterium]
MIANTKFHEALRLLAEGKLSRRKIAATVGISRATVSAIASGRCRNPDIRRAERGGDAPFAGPLVRCPGCGGKVFLPCLVCRAEAQQEREREVMRIRRRLAAREALMQLLGRLRQAQWERDAREAQQRAIAGARCQPQLPVGQQRAAS